MLEPLFNKVVGLKRCATLSKRDSSRSVFLRKWWNLQEHLLLQGNSDDCFWNQKFFYFSAPFVMISFLFETCGYANNPNFIHFRRRWKRKYVPAKFVIRVTVICGMEIRLNLTNIRFLSYLTRCVFECILTLWVLVFQIMKNSFYAY